MTLGLCPPAMSAKKALCMPITSFLKRTKPFLNCARSPCSARPAGRGGAPRDVPGAVTLPRRWRRLCGAPLSARTAASKQGAGYQCSALGPPGGRTAPPPLSADCAAPAAPQPPPMAGGRTIDVALGQHSGRGCLHETRPPLPLEPLHQHARPLAERDPVRENPHREAALHCANLLCAAGWCCGWAAARARQRGGRGSASSLRPPVAAAAGKTGGKTPGPPAVELRLGLAALDGVRPKSVRLRPPQPELRDALHDGVLQQVQRAAGQR